MLPDEDLVPAPVVKLAEPPVPLVPRPELSEMSPPAETVDPVPTPPIIFKVPPNEESALLSPASRLNIPPSELSPREFEKRKDPDFPTTEFPVVMTNAPLLPDEEVPVLKNISPDIPRVPALEVLTIRLPLDDVEDNPVRIETEPPESPLDKPLDKKISEPERAFEVPVEN